MQKINVTKLLKEAVPALIFLVIVCIYFAPLLEGKVLMQSDNVHLSGTGSEYTVYQEKGEVIRWTNKEFGGVPRLSGSQYNIFKWIQHIFFYQLLPKPIMMVLFLFLGFFIFMKVLKVNHWLAAVGGLAFAFGTFNIISLEAGHDNKVIAIACMAPILAGVIATYRGNWVTGGILTFVFSGLQLYYGHIQITYYTLLMVLIYLIIVLTEYYRSRAWPNFIKGSLILAGATVLAFGCNFGKLYTTLEYSDYSTRGGSELTSDEASETRSGLDKDYALQWSNGVLETFTVLIPYFHGGASSEKLSENSNMFNALVNRNVPLSNARDIISNVPLYWGTQPFTAGPIYFGVIIVLLFIMSFNVLEGNLRWWGLATAVLALLLAMGKNLEWFTDIFFYHVPLYNKFRSVTMILCVAHLSMVTLGILCLDQVLDKKHEKSLLRSLKIGAGALAGLCLLFLIGKGAFFDFSSPNDGRYGYPDWLINALVQDRKSLFNSDIIRSLIFGGVALTVIWLFVKNRMKVSHLITVIAVLVLIDLWGVNRRYLNNDDFLRKRSSNRMVQPTSANQVIMRDQGYFRVFNLTVSPFNDGTTSHFHFSVGGYSAIKFQRYQELIDRYISQMHRPVLNMLNTKYFIVNDDQGQPSVQQNPAALGPVWLVRDLRWMETANDEIAYLDEFDPSSTAVSDKKFQEVVTQNTYSGDGLIRLADYHPEKMTYSFESATVQLAVFSDMYYQPGWKAYIDGKQVDHFRVNYVLRGLEVPPGDHEIVFRYEPVSAKYGDHVAIASGALGVVLMFIMIFLSKKEINVREEEMGTRP